MKLYICYRRADTRTTTKRIAEEIATYLPDWQVLIDLAETIPKGPNFSAALSQQVHKADVILAIIGPDWLTIKDERGNRRLGNPLDFVRIEVEAGLSGKNTRLLTVLVEGAHMPNIEDLPESLQELVNTKAVIIVNEGRSRLDFEKLIETIQQSALL